MTAEGRRLGVDHGSKRVGLALSDEEGRLARPFETLVRDAPPAAVAARVVERAAAEEVVEIVVGLPLGLEGQEGASARGARAFARLLEQATELPVVLWDERLTTAEAERALDAMGVRGKRRKALIDQVAASLLLQSYLDRLAYARGEDPGEPWLDGPGAAVPDAKRGSRRSRRR
jgi:putative Holliday junction resolvase